MTFQQRVGAFVQLGDFLREVSVNDHPAFAKAYVQNHWFTIENIRTALASWAEQLSRHKLEEWLSAYAIAENNEPQRIAVIMAGNIPLVGFHDLLCVLISGSHALVKLSEDDSVLPRLMMDELIRIEPSMATMISIVEGRLPSGFDAVIATGSNNTNRYFEYYFRNTKSLLRKSRSAVAVLSGNETPEDLQLLGADIFTYFGLGCRNVSKLFVPRGYDFTPFFEGIENWNDIIHHNKYANNYTYHKAIFLMNQTLHLDNNFLLVKEDDHIASPLATLFYSSYRDLADVVEQLNDRAEQIQCMVSRLALPNALPPGKAQHPELWDYADGVDTMKFLLG